MHRVGLGVIADTLINIGRITAHTTANAISRATAIWPRGSWSRTRLPPGW
jgi:hypothetical protein